MNNVITVLVDSVFSDCLSNGKSQISSTPFIDSLKMQSLFASNIYSYGPYTDVASNSLYCFAPALDEYGYFFGINSKRTNHFKLFKKNGYETIGFCYPFYLFGSKVRKYIDKIVITSGFKYGSEWFGKFEYYAKQKETCKLTSTEYLLLEKQVDLMFDCWLSMYEEFDTEIGSLLSNKMFLDKSKPGQKALREENARYHQDRQAYIDSMLDRGMNHPLALINDIELAVDVDFLKTSVYGRHKSFFSKVKKVTLRGNAPNRIDFKKGVECISRRSECPDGSSSRYLGNCGMAMLYPSLQMKRSLGDDWQEFPSFDCMIRAAMDAIDSRENQDTPFYLSLHPEEPHNNIAFFSYTSSEIEKIDEEIEYLAPLVNGCGKNFKGNLSYLLSLRYTDLCIKKLFDELETRGLLDSTTVMIVSDHGSSYMFDPPRNSVVNNFHTENYKIPMMIWQKNMPKKFCGEATAIYMSDDVFPTLCEIIGLKKPNRSVDYVITPEGLGRPYALTEYMGPGCPDMINRAVWMSARSNEWVLAYQLPINMTADLSNPSAIYRIGPGYDESVNLVKNIVIDEIEELRIMKKAIGQRHAAIRKNTEEFLNNLSSYSPIVE